MNKIHQLSTTDNKEDFLKRFSSIPERVSDQKRPLPPADYWSYLYKVFQYRDQELYFYESQQGDMARLAVFNSEQNPEHAFFGMMEFHQDHPDLIQELLALAKTWAQQKQKKIFIGPIDYSVWYGNRLKTNGFDLSLSWEPNNPNFYPKALTNFGLSKDQSYLSCFFESNELCWKRTSKGYQLAIHEGYEFYPLSIDGKESIEKFYQLNTNCFRDNYLYEDISLEEYERTLIEFLKDIDLKYCFGVKDQSGKEKGYVFSFVDTAGYLIIKSLLIVPDSRGAKLSSALVYKSIDEARKDGVLKTAGALVRAGNVSEHFFSGIGEISRKHEYALFSQEI